MSIETLKEKLKYYGEITILELLEINAEDLLLRFEDKLEEKYDELYIEFLEGEEQDESE